MKLCKGMILIELLPFHMTSRVESVMAKGIQSSIRATTKASKKKIKAAQDDQKKDRYNVNETQGSDHVQKKNLKRQRETIEEQSGSDRDWQKAENRKRINDIVKAPPLLTKVPRGESYEAKKRKAKLQAALLGRDENDNSVLSDKARLPDPLKKGGLRREAMLKEERAKAIQAYRSNKKKTLGTHLE